MNCKECHNEISDNAKFCSNCGKENAIDKIVIEDGLKKDNTVPWYRNLKWQHLLLVSLVCLIIYFATGGYIWDFIFLIALIFAIIDFIKSRKKK